VRKAINAVRHRCCCTKSLLGSDQQGSVHLLPPHIEKEEKVLFRMAESMLSEREWVEVRRLWKDALEAPNEA